MRTYLRWMVIFLCCVFILVAHLGLAAERSGRVEAGPDALPLGALKHSTSTYLLLAADSPVRWQPWSQQTFALARSLHRPLLIDIGAAWCHACHAMDQTTYRDPTVVQLINRYFVPVRVDADERPDIDAFYHRAARVADVGGIPLTCFAASDGAPIYIEGFLPAKLAGRNIAYGMIYSLRHIGEDYSKNPDAVGSSEMQLPPQEGDLGSFGDSAGQELRKKIADSFERSYDDTYGGFGKYSGQRFTNFPAIRFSLAHGFLTDPRFTAIALESLRKIPLGGIYDQLGGGFFRFSIDHAWRVPHFEKTSQDQAMALSIYAEAYEASGDEEFARIARSLVGYVNGNLLDPKLHVFYASQDADSGSGDDGGYYTWTPAEIRHALPPAQARVALLYFGFDTEAGTTENQRVVLRRAIDITDLAKRLGVSPTDAAHLVGQASQNLLAARTRRKAPHVDRTVMTDRNALMASAYLRASAAIREPQLEQIALDDLDFILARMRSPDGGFYHTWSASGPKVYGLVADQVYLMGALLQAYEATGQSRYLNEAQAIANLIVKDFTDPASGMLRDRSPSLGGTVLAKAPADPAVFYDEQLPGVEASASLAFATLGAITSNTAYNGAADRLIDKAPTSVALQALPIMGTTGLALDRERASEVVVAVAGTSSDPRTRELLEIAERTYRPFKVVIAVNPSSPVGSLPPAACPYFAATAAQKGSRAFVCAGTVCATPTDQPSKLAKTIRTLAMKISPENSKKTAAR